MVTAEKRRLDKPEKRHPDKPEKRRPDKPEKVRSTPLARLSDKGKMVNGRVNERVAARAANVLSRNDLTISSFIRNSIEYVAATGEVPACGFPTSVPRIGTDRLRSIVQRIEQTPMPGRKDYASFTEEEMVERVRLERYGY